MRGTSRERILTDHPHLTAYRKAKADENEQGERS